MLRRKALMALLVTLCLAIPAAARPGSNVKLQVRETELRDVLMILAKTAKTNILVSKSVRGKTSLELTDVPALTAIGLVARINGYKAALVEGVVCVGTAEDVAGLRQGGDLAVLQLRHAKSADMAAIIAKAVKDVDIIEDPRTNSVIIRAPKQ